MDAAWHVLISLMCASNRHLPYRGFAPQDSITHPQTLVENECVMAVVTQLYLGKFLKINYMFRPLIMWALIRLKQEIIEKITQDST
jgi:hypothetical protein